MEKPIIKSVDDLLGCAIVAAMFGFALIVIGIGLAVIISAFKG